VAVSTAQHLRDKAPLLRKSERWLSEKAIRRYQCKGMINIKDGKRGMGLRLGVRSRDGRRKTYCREKMKLVISSPVLFFLKWTYFFFFSCIMFSF